MTWSHVTGELMSIPAFSTNDLRNHSTCTFDQNGATTSSSSQVAASRPPWNDCSFRLARRSSGSGAR